MPDLLEAVMSRLCHDLAGPSSAVANGVELISELGSEPGDDSITMVEGSAQSLIGRLQYFRFAFGQAGSRSPLPLSEVEPIAAAFLAERRLTVSWMREGHADVLERPGALPCALIALFVVADSLPRGGEATVHLANSDVEIEISPSSGALSQETLQHVTSLKETAVDGSVSEPIEYTPKVAPAVALRHKLLALGGEAEMTEEDGVFALSLRFS